MIELISRPVPDRADDPAYAVEIRTLGGFALLRGGHAVALYAWPSRKARDLLKLLVARRGRPTPRETLCDALWPEVDPRRCANRLSVALSTVRSALDPEHVHPADHYVAADRWVVGLRNLRIDVEQFLAAAHGLGPNPELALLRAVESTYAGDFLADDPFLEWAAPLRDEARTAYLALTRSLAHTAALLGEPDLAVRYFLRVLDHDAYDEQAHLRLVAVLSAAGRHGEARRRHQLYTDRMTDLGIHPAAFPAPRGQPGSKIEGNLKPRGHPESAGRSSGADPRRRHPIHHARGRTVVPLLAKPSGGTS